MSQNRYNRISDTIKTRCTLDDLIERTRLTATTLNDIDALQHLASSSPHGTYDDIPGLRERLINDFYDYAFMLGYTNTREAITNPVDITEIETEISTTDTIYNYDTFQNARTEYALGEAYALSESK